MSSAGRANRRRADDAYLTPTWAVAAILPHLPRPSFALEPACGTGRILRAMRARWYQTRLAGWDLAPGAQAMLTRHRADLCGLGEAGLTQLAELEAEAQHDWPTDCDRVECNTLETRFQHRMSRPDLVISNPPYSLAREFVEHSIANLVSQDVGRVAMLLRLGFLGSQRRGAWLRRQTPSVYVLPRRPSFTGRGTDARDYAWMVWTVIDGQVASECPNLRILEV